MCFTGQLLCINSVWTAVSDGFKSVYIAAYTRLLSAFIEQGAWGGYRLMDFQAEVFASSIQDMEIWARNLIRDKPSCGILQWKPKY